MSTASRTILCVDDEPNILSSMKRLFRATGHHVMTAEGGEEALTMMETTPADLVISDMRMPGMSGAELLHQVRQRWPRATRLLLTGYADITSTIAAINEGRIHRYITKPWNDEDLLMTVREAFERQGLREEKERLEELTTRQNEALRELNATLEHKVRERTAELTCANDRLHKNYLDSIKAFSHLIELRGGGMAGHARRVADLARRTARALGLDDTRVQELFIAALMHDIGHIGLSDRILETPVSKLGAEDLARYRQHPELGEQALMGMDDMPAVATLIRHHHERHDGRGFPDGLAREQIPLGARILAIADAYDDLLHGHVISGQLTPAEARALIARGRHAQFDPAVTDAFLALLNQPAAPPSPRPVELDTEALQPGMVLARDFQSAEGVLLLAADHVLTEPLIARIRQYERRSRRPLVLAVKPV